MTPFIDRAFASYYEAHPLVLVDVGAAGGIKPRWRAARSHLRVIAFEPDERAVFKLDENLSVKLIPIGLLDECGQAQLFLTKNQGSSSFLRPNARYLRPFSESKMFEVGSTRTVNVDTLDRQLTSIGVDDVDFLKLDTQGTELQVLRGSQSILRTAPVFGVQVEVEFAQIYEGQPLFPDVDGYLRQNGFELFDLRTCYWKRTVGQAVGGPKGQLIWGDALYLGELEQFFAALDRLHDSVRRAAKLLKAISICLLYGYFDYALELSRTGRSRGLITGPEHDTIERAILSEVPVSNRLPRIRGRGRLAHAFYRLYHALRPERVEAIETGRFSTNERFLGNTL